MNMPQTIFSVDRIDQTEEKNVVEKLQGAPKLHADLPSMAWAKFTVTCSSTPLFSSSLWPSASLFSGLAFSTILDEDLTVQQCFNDQLLLVIVHVLCITSSAGSWCKFIGSILCLEP
jgi:hypothetical protein